MLHARMIDVSAHNTSRSAYPWRSISILYHPDMTTTDRRDLLSRFEGTYGKRIMGTMKTNKCRHVTAKFRKEWTDGETITTVSWFEEDQ